MNMRFDQPVKALVTRVFTGDCFEVRNIYGKLVEVRLAGVCAPIKGDVGFRECAQSLRKLINKQNIILYPKAADPDGRSLVQAVSEEHGSINDKMEKVIARY